MRTRTNTSVIIFTILAVCTAFLLTPDFAHGQSSGFQLIADAYGTQATVGNTVVAGRTAVATLGSCGVVEPPAHSENTVASADVAPLLVTGVVNTTADATALTGEVQATATADVHDAALLITLLGGVITADEIEAVSTTTHDNTGFHTNADGSTFVNLVVAGIPIIVSPAPNTEIALPGFGRVVLNEQVTTLRSRSASFAVNMIHVFIEQQNILNIPIGAEIIVSHASSGLNSGVQATLDGQAYGTKASVAHTVTSGPTALEHISCLGTNGALKTNSVAGVQVPLLFSVGEVTDTAQGTVDPTSAAGELTSTIQSIDVVSSLVTATLVKADAHASNEGGTSTFSDDGTMFVGLHVTGFPHIGDDVPANTRLRIAGLGTLWLHRVIQNSNSIEVRMIEVIVTEANVFGIDIGTDIQVAVAEASVH
ncbi:MAG TPA: choice-of-anchor P family protein [Candidatus Udaeobacter sp.]|nr:choice-of-anchor P family protein [Candidatus Udaeobacter sp.]